MITLTHADWMIFADRAVADAAIVAISAAMEIGPGGEDVTTTWAVPVATADGKWAVPKPDDAALVGVAGYTIGVPVWPADPGMGGD